MEPDIVHHKEAIVELCRSLGVESLLTFGEAARTPRLTGNDSLVFLVQFKPMPSGQYAACYFSLAAELEALLRTPIELVELEAGDNPYFKEPAGETRLPVHELSHG
jgi:predicted nucleotidyltransferase